MKPRKHRVEWGKVVHFLRMLWHRTLIAAYVAVGLSLIWHFQDRIFYSDVSEDDWHIYRLIWCFSVSLVVGAAGLWVRHHDCMTSIHYIIYYPSLLAAFACLTLAGLHLSSATSGRLFYYFSFGLCTLLSLSADEVYSTLVAVFANLRIRLGLGK